MGVNQGGGHIQNQLRQLIKECYLDCQLGKGILQQKYGESADPHLSSSAWFSLTITLQKKTFTHEKTLAKPYNGSQKICSAKPVT